VNATRFAIRKAISDLAPADLDRLFDRGRAADPAVRDAVAAIIADVRARGDDALRDLARRFDRAELASIEVNPRFWDAALAALDPDLRAALERAAAHIAEFHRAQLPPPLELELRPGLFLGRRADPIARVGVYAPGGRAAYPSSVLMGVVPAKVAGVGEVVVCSPPGPDGLPSPAVLAACALAGADRVFALGGAGAIAALAYGTATVPAVDRVVGPGNAYVTEAKRQCTGRLAIDSPAGPSEVLILADDGADAELVAIELLAQAEHDPDAAAVLVSTSARLIEEAAAAVERLLPAQPKRAIIEESLAARGALLLAASVDEAVAFNEAYAPEHLLVLLEAPRAVLARLRNAGTIFLGAGSSVAFGDYMTGANHVLPTAGLARAYSGLSVLDFLRWTTYQEVRDVAARELSGPVALLATAEGLPAHAAAARMRGAGDRGAAPAAAALAAAPPGVAAPPANAVEPPPAAIPLRPAYRELALYDPGRRPVAVDLSDNTNLWGPAPSAARAFAELLPERIVRYPGVYADELRRALAELHGVSPANVTTGAGSDDVIDSAIRAFCEPGDAVVHADPTFSMVPVFARMNACRPLAVPLGAGFALDADALAAARGRVTYVCNPNNPTGTLFAPAEIERIAAGSAGVVLVDEAYADFAGADMASRAVDTGRIVVLRTLSKAWGLAGVRVGYAIGPARLIAEIEKSRGPYKVSGPAEAAALAVLRHDRDWVERTVAQVRRNRDRLAAALRDIGLHTWPSAANFLLVQVPEGWRAPPPADPRTTVVQNAAPYATITRAQAFAAALRERGVAVRPFPALPLAGDCVRVTVGPWPLLERFLGAVEEVLG